MYVDDIIITSDDSKGLHDFKTFLQNSFQTNDLHKLRYLLGIEVARSKEGIDLSQRRYMLDILEEIGLLGSIPVETPMDHNVKVLLAKRYRHQIGKLNYLTITRLDILFAVSVVS